MPRTELKSFAVEVQTSTWTAVNEHQNVALILRIFNEQKQLFCLISRCHSVISGHALITFNWFYCYLKIHFDSIVLYPLKFFVCTFIKSIKH